MTTKNPALNYADLWRPQAPAQSWAYSLALVVGGSLFIALAAQIAIPLPFTPVPVTGQSLAVLLLGVLLGSRKGAASVLLYLGEGAMGLPFFAKGAAGLAILRGATAGYLLGFVVAAFVVGWLAERGWDRDLWRSGAAMMVGNAIIFACGLTWLSYLVGFSKALTLGFYPFVPGMLVKLVLASALLPIGWNFIKYKK
ncbi:MAG: biotin transporter BioY [Deltaproteobacteria bacterium]|nr:MAG: biotin transporter BioY [Deltaproteobacteria bacterium]